MKIQARKLARAVNLPLLVGDHILGENHHPFHRISIGVIIMIIGVSIAKIHSPITIVTILIDGTGYTLHGIGAIPIIESFMKIKEHVDGKQGKRKGKIRGHSSQRHRSRATETTVSSD